MPFSYHVLPWWPGRGNQRMQAKALSVGAAGICEGSVYPISVNHCAGPLWPDIMKSLPARGGWGHCGDSCQQRVWQPEIVCWENLCCLLVAESSLSEPRFPFFWGKWERHSSLEICFEGCRTLGKQTWEVFQAPQYRPGFEHSPCGVTLPSSLLYRYGQGAKRRGVPLLRK